MDIAKVFMTGRSQAVRLPKAYRFDTDEVLIEKQADGGVLLRPRRVGPLGDRLWAILNDLPDDPTFVRPDQGAAETRDWFDDVASNVNEPRARVSKPRARRLVAGRTKSKQQ